VSGITLGQPDPPRTRLGFRFAVFGLAVVLAVAGLTTRLFYLQIGRGGYYSSVNGENRLTLAPVQSVRGLIYDRAGRLLATNVASYVITVTPADLPFPQRDRVVDRLAQLLAITREQIIEALDRNAGLRFVCREVEVAVDSTATAWTSACPSGATLTIPVKHGEGRYVHPDPAALAAAGQVVFRYAPGHNPNGSQADIAGVTNPTGNVVGLMPHPEHAVDGLTGPSQDGLGFFTSILKHLAGAPAEPAGVPA